MSNARMPNAIIAYDAKSEEKRIVVERIVNNNANIEVIAQQLKISTNEKVIVVINSSLRSIGSEKYISQLLFRCTKENKKTGSAKLMMIDSTREVIVVTLKQSAASLPGVKKEDIEIAMNMMPKNTHAMILLLNRYLKQFLLIIRFAPSF